MAREGGVVVNRRHDGKVTYWTHPEAVDGCIEMQARYGSRHRIYPCRDGYQGLHWHTTTKEFRPEYLRRVGCDG